MTGPRLLFTLCLLGLVSSLLWLRQASAPLPVTAQPVRPPLVVLCAASNRTVMEEVARRYVLTGGGEIQFQYGASQSLLATAAISQTGDLYLPADDSYLKQAQQKQLIGPAFPVARMRVVLAVPAGNPRGVVSLADLAQRKLKLAQGDPDSAAIGLITKTALTASGHWDALVPVSSFRPTVVEALNDLKIGAADAAITYDVLLRQQPELESVVLPELTPLRAHIAIAVLRSSQHPDEAAAFVKFLTAPDRGLAVYAERGFEVDATTAIPPSDAAKAQPAP